MRECADLKAQLDAAMGALESGNITLEASAVEQVSTGALQCLLAFMRSAEKRSLQATLQSPSPALTGAIESLGLTPAFTPYRS